MAYIIRVMYAVTRTLSPTSGFSSSPYNTPSLAPNDMQMTSMTHELHCQMPRRTDDFRQTAWIYPGISHWPAGRTSGLMPECHCKLPVSFLYHYLRKPDNDRTWTSSTHFTSICSENFWSTQLNSTQPEITDAGVWHLYVRIIINKTIL